MDPKQTQPLNLTVMNIFASQIRLNQEATSTETCKSPRRGPTPVSFTGSSMLGSNSIGCDGNSCIRSRCESFLSNMVRIVLLTSPPTSFQFRLRSIRSTNRTVRRTLSFGKTSLGDVDGVSRPRRSKATPAAFCLVRGWDHLRKTEAVPVVSELASLETRQPPILRPSPRQL